MSLVDEYKADGTINIAQLDMAGISLIQTVENLIRDKQVIERVISFGIAWMVQMVEAVELRHHVERENDRKMEEEEERMAKRETSDKRRA